MLIAVQLVPEGTSVQEIGRGVRHTTSLCSKIHQCRCQRKKLDVVCGTPPGFICTSPFAVLQTPWQYGVRLPASKLTFCGVSFTFAFPSLCSRLCTSIQTLDDSKYRDFELLSVRSSNLILNFDSKSLSRFASSVSSPINSTVLIAVELVFKNTSVLETRT
jgi:hypothetical protein